MFEKNKLAYEHYLALKRFFTTKKGKLFTRDRDRIPVSDDTFRKHGIRITPLVRRYGDNLTDYFVANFISGDAGGGLYTEGHQKYTEWKKRTEALTYTFKTDMATIVQRGPDPHLSTISLKDVFEFQPTQHPLILRLFLGNFCSPETLVILGKLISFRDVYDKRMQHDPVWASVSLLMKKYEFFLTFDKKKFKEVCETFVHV